MPRRRSYRVMRSQSLGALGEPITGSAFLLYAGGAALLALLFGRKKTTTQRSTTAPGAGAKTDTGTGTGTQTGTTTAGGGVDLLPGPRTLAPGVIQFPVSSSPPRLPTSGRSPARQRTSSRSTRLSTGSIFGSVTPKAT